MTFQPKIYCVFYVTAYHIYHSIWRVFCFVFRFMCWYVFWIIFLFFFSYSCEFMRVRQRQRCRSSERASIPYLVHLCWRLAMVRTRFTVRRYHFMKNMSKRVWTFQCFIFFFSICHSFFFVSFFNYTAIVEFVTFLPFSAETFETFLIQYYVVVVSFACYLCNLRGLQSRTAHRWPNGNARLGGWFIIKMYITCE